MQGKHAARLYQGVTCDAQLLKDNAGGRAAVDPCAFRPNAVGAMHNTLDALDACPLRFGAQVMRDVGSGP